MASQKEKLAIQEDLNNAFIDQNAKVYVEDYKIHINNIQNKAIDQVSKGVRPTQKGLFKSFRLTGINRNVRNAFILGNINQLIQHDRDRVLQRKLMPMTNLMKLYSVKNPLLFASKIDKLIKRSLGIKVQLNPREVKAFGEIKQFLDKNKKQIQTLIDSETKRLRVINKQITTNQSRTIIKARNRLIKERITVKGVTRPLTNEEIATRLRSQFKDDSARLERILQTETHRQNELVREVTAKGLGFTHKIWNTQRDTKVRDTHEVLDRKKKRINQFFKVGKGKAQQPGAATLPPEESINCRCFLTYTN